MGAVIDGQVGARASTCVIGVIEESTFTLFTRRVQNISSFLCSACKEKDNVRLTGAGPIRRGKLSDHRLKLCIFNMVPYIYMIRKE